ncbi:hypothetical protein C8Q75DRAFT_4286 [Abortiporus biennis]|nr:hypothetical protein C8Q75DRAFT_4286 [Abortiporus biennis]
MPNPYRPEEDENTLNLERNFLAGDLICGIGYGIQIVLYSRCAWYLWKQRKQKRHTLLFLGYITILFCISTIFTAIQARTVQVVYVENRNYPGGPWKFFLASQHESINVIFYATFFLVTFLSDCLVAWRCWIIWSASGMLAASLVTLVPVMMLLSSFVMGTLWTLQSSRPGLSLYSKVPLAYGTSYYALSLSLNVLLTFLIALRLLLYRRTIVKALPEEYGKPYLSIATIIVESAAIYSVFAILFLITYAVNDPVNQTFIAVSQASQQIATYLIIYRLADGRAWGSNTIAPRKGRPNHGQSATPKSPQTTDLDIEFGTPISKDSHTFTSVCPSRQDSGYDRWYNSQERNCNVN